MGLLSDFYNTVARFFRPQEEFVEGEGNSKSVATNRLKLVLMQDRTNLTPKILEQMRGELVDLLSKYLEMDKDLLELNFEQEGDQVALMLSIPVIRAKDEDEIEEALKASAENTSEEDESEEDSEEENSEEETEGTEKAEESEETVSEEGEENTVTDEDVSEETEDATENAEKVISSENSEENIEESAKA